MNSAEPSQPQPPVSSLRHKFEQIAASSSAPQLSPSISPGSSTSPRRSRASSNADLVPQQAPVDAKRIVSGPSDILGVPILRPSPSSPDLNGNGKIKPVVPPPRCSRTPSPQPPPAPIPPVPPPRGNSLSNTVEPMSPPAHRKSASYSRRPPPPPPPKPVTASPESTTPPSGGVASLRSKFGADNLGNGHPAARNTTPRSASVCQPPALPARPNDGKTSSVKIPRASLPSLSSFASDPPSHITPNEASTSHFDASYSLLRPPPPVPLRSNTDSLIKIVNATTRHDMEGAIDSASLETHTSSNESTSSENGAPQALKRRVPPRPPVSQPSLTMCPPPLPPRRNASDEQDDPSPTGPPPLPHRRSFDPSSPLSSSALPSVTSKPSSRIDGITPPPARVIGLKDKLPPVRRHFNSSDSEESEGEQFPADHPAASTSRLSRTPEDLPDTTHCSRRLPLPSDYKFAKSRVRVASPSSVVAVSGPNVVVASHHHMKLFNLSIGDAPVSTIELKDLPVEWRLKDSRVTAMEFRAGEGEDSGNFLWCGTKDGHLWEFDVKQGAVVRVRNAVHGHAVTHILRHGRCMITLDESGKALIWKDYQDLHTNGQPRIARVAEKQGFVKMFGGLLWTSNGHGNGGAPAGTSRSPVIRVYDILVPNCSTKIITPPEALGAVTSGTILHSQPHLVYLGHEGGYVTSWSLASPSGIPDTFDSGRPVPSCVHVSRISISDVLALEGVGNRLWAGARKGIVSVYDVQTKPWTMTNSWQAHEELPVLKLMVDPFSIGKCQRMHVVSVGRDETMRFWDGLLGRDWVANELQAREGEFSTFRDVKVLICSWNTDAQKPEALTGSADNVNFLETVLHSVDCPDIIVFGFQEVIDLENRKITAKTVLLGNQKKNTDGLSEKISRSYRLWHDHLVQSLRIAMPVDDPYVVVHTDNLVGLFSCIFVRQRQRHLLRDSAITTVKRGLGGRYGNKGAIVARFVIDDSSLCFINCHLAAGQSRSLSRNQDVAAILEEGAALPSSDLAEALPYVGGGDGSMILDHEICFLNGDLNYRIDQRRDTVISAVNDGELDYLLSHDQLRKQAKNNPGFRLRAFVEAPISFAPTYKYDRRSNNYDSSEKKRAPAWCDRILHRCRDPSRVQSLHYRRYEANVSDHRPISAGFRVTVKSIRHEERAVVKAQIERQWQERSIHLLFNAQEFYATQQIL